MAPSKRKRPGKRLTRPPKSKPLVIDSEYETQASQIGVSDTIHDDDNDQQQNDEIAVRSKKQKKNHQPVDQTLTADLDSSAEDGPDVEHNLTQPHEDSDETPVAKVKKPAFFKLRSDSPLAKASQTARPSKGNPKKMRQTSNVTEDLEDAEEGLVISSPSFTTKLEPAIASDECMNDSDEIHSLNMRIPNTPVREVSTEPQLVYLDSFPDIKDSGLKRYKEIQNNPLTLGDNEIDPLLRAELQSLPSLRDSTVIPFVKFGQPRPEAKSNTALRYKDMINIMYDVTAGKSRLDAALNFTHILPFVNPSRASPDLVMMDSGKICFKPENAKLGRNAVFLTTGLIVDSFLKDPADSMINPGNKIQQLSLLAFCGEDQRLLAYIGTVFDADKYICLLEAGKLIVTTRKEGAGGDHNNLGYYGTTSASNSPAKSRIPASLLTTSPVKLATSPNPDRGKSSHFSPSLGFKDHVPVYDARANPTFMFDKDGMKNLNKLPLYNNDKSDIPSCKYLATVGYTVGSWKTKASPEDEETFMCASLNLQFVIIIGKVNMKNVS